MISLVQKSHLEEINTKKLLAILLALVVMFSFAACGTDKTGEADTTEKIEDTTKADAAADAAAGATADVDAGATADADTTADVEAAQLQISKQARQQMHKIKTKSLRKSEAFCFDFMVINQNL
ncbi:MAG: hypothetical protein IKT78_00045 [Ruminiclostridium sp.]|nr:hypothetical protein [Ruminiclostridium sp.]